MQGAEELIEKLTDIESELSDLAMSKLREGMESGDTSLVDEEKRITRARRAIEKAAQLLRSPAA